MSQQKCDALKIAGSYAAVRFPGSVLPEMKPVISEQKDRWIVTYELPIHMLGGSPVIAIDKNTCKVIDAYHTQ